MIKVIGCPRSGTRYASEVFRAHEIDVQHERMGKDGTSDWRLALSARAFMSGVVLHQVRDPLHVIPSLSTIMPKSWKLIEKCISFRRAAYDMQDLERRCHLWLVMTSRADIVADHTYRVEDMRSEWPRIAQICGFPVTQWCGDKVPANVNHRPHARLTVDELMECELGPLVLSKAHNYGYRHAVS